MLGHLITLETFENAMQASLVKQHLEAAGIRCVLADEFTVSNFWHLSNAIGGIKLQVAEEDFERASALLAAQRREDVPGISYADEADEAEEEPQQIEPKPGVDDEEQELPLNEREENVERAYRAVLIGLVLSPVQFYATWILLDVWKSDLPLRPAIRHKLSRTIWLHLPMLAFAIFLLWVGSQSLMRPTITDAIVPW
jgi:hypothetical protein